MLVSLTHLLLFMTALTVLQRSVVHEGSCQSISYQLQYTYLFIVSSMANSQYNHTKSSENIPVHCQYQGKAVWLFVLASAKVHPESYALSVLITRGSVVAVDVDCRSSANSAAFVPAVSSPAGMFLAAGECVIPLTYALPQIGWRPTTSSTTTLPAPTEISGGTAPLAEAMYHTASGGLLYACGKHACSGSRAAAAHQSCQSVTQQPRRIRVVPLTPFCRFRLSRVALGPGRQRVVGHVAAAVSRQHLGTANRRVGKHRRCST